MSKLYLLPLLIIVFVSGCINPFQPPSGSVGGDDVVKITDIKLSSSSLTTLQTLTVEAIVKNADPVLTNNPVEAKIRLSNPTCDVIGVKTTCPSGITEIEGDKSKGWGCDKLNLQPIGENSGGDRVIWKVTFNNPLKLKNIQSACDFEIITNFGYETTGLTKLDFEDYQSFSSERERSRKSPDKGIGPVKVYFESNELQPILVNPEAKDKISLVLHVENIKQPRGDEIETRIVNNRVTISDTNLFNEFDGNCNVDGTETKVVTGSVLKVPNTKSIVCTVDTPTKQVHKEIVVQGSYEYEIVHKTPSFNLVYR